MRRGMDQPRRKRGCALTAQLSSAQLGCRAQSTLGHNENSYFFLFISKMTTAFDDNCKQQNDKNINRGLRDETCIVVAKNVIKS
jgi:hypothetical protein